LGYFASEVDVIKYVPVRNFLHMSSMIPKVANILRLPRTGENELWTLLRMRLGTCTLVVAAIGWLRLFPFLFPFSHLMMSSTCCCPHCHCSSALVRGGFQFSTFTNRQRTWN